MALRENVAPPIDMPLIPRDRKTDTIIKFFCIFKSTRCSIFMPLQAINPYKIIALHANTQLGIEAMKACTGAKKPRTIRKIEARPVTHTDATLEKPIHATDSP